MAKKPWNEAVKTALRMYTQRDKYCYLYGAKGQMLGSEATIREFMKMEAAYFAKYTDAEKLQIIRNSLGKIAYDCSGFVGWACTGDKQYSTGQINNADHVTKDLAAGPAGSILYTTYGGTGRHIGLDIGYGYCIDMARESTDANKAAGMDSVRLYKISDGICAWEKSGQSRVLDYAGADAR